MQLRRFDHMIVNNSGIMNALKMRCSERNSTCKNLCCHEKVATMATNANFLNSVD